jgi:hypothetical protein
MIARVLAVAVAFVIAILAAGALLALAIWVAMLAATGFASIDLGLLKYLLLFTVALTAILAGAPTLLLVTYAEWAGKSSAGYYAAAGAICGIVALGLHIALSVWRSGSSRLLDGILAMQGLPQAGGLLVAVAVIGLIAGLLYWAMAGRRAGLVRG